MADFMVQYKKTCVNEGLLSNDSGDSGGLTWKGISIVYEKDWKGWAIITQTVSDLGLRIDQLDNPASLKKVSAALVANEALEAQVQAIYKSKYWDVMRLDACPSQSIAGELFDSGVNMGVGTVVKFLQRALNVLNQQGKLYGNVTVDGSFGQGTFNALQGFFNGVVKDRWITLWKILNALQGVRYVEICEKNPGQEKFIYGWITRVFEGV
jgi:lysozyme family protein